MQGILVFGSYEVTPQASCPAGDRIQGALWLSLPRDSYSPSTATTQVAWGSRVSIISRMKVSTWHLQAHAHKHPNARPWCLRHEHQVCNTIRFWSHRDTIAQHTGARYLSASIKPLPSAGRSSCPEQARRRASAGPARPPPAPGAPGPPPCAGATAPCCTPPGPAPNPLLGKIMLFLGVMQQNLTPCAGAWHAVRSNEARAQQPSLRLYVGKHRTMGWRALSRT